MEPQIQAVGLGELVMFPVRRRDRLSICLAILLSAGAMVSCTLSPERAGFRASEAETSSATVKKVAAAGELELVGKVKVDEFNDAATGKEIPRDGGDLVVRFPAEPNSLNPWTDNSAYSQYIHSYVFNTLLRLDPETFEYEPSLAERWIEEDIVVKQDGTKLRGTATADSPGGDVAFRTAAGTVSIPRREVKEVHRGVSFTFFLRRDVKFHDGKPVTAADVKFSFDTLKNEHVDAPALRSYYNDLESCEVLDAYTVRLTYSKQYWMARSFAGLFEILPKHLYDWDDLQEKDPEAFGKRFNESEYNRKPVGTGPYRFERWDTGLQVALTRNEDYWDIPRRGHLDRILFRFITDDVAALQGLKGGEVDFIPEATPEQFEDEASDPEFLRKFVKAEYYTGGFRYVGWNMRRPPFDDPNVRLAMAYGALDREQFVEKILHGHGIVVTGAQYFFGPAYDHSVQPHPFDPDKAKQLLLESGWYDRDGDGLRDKNGQALRFEMLQPSGFELYQRRAALMKENLRKLGIEMTVRELEWATFLEHINDRKFDACSLGWGTPVESDPYQLWHTSQRENRGSNYVGFGDGETDRLIERSRLTLDDTERRKMFFQLHRILHERQPYLFMYTEADLGLYDKRFRGVKLYKVRPGWDFSEWYLPKDDGQEPGVRSQNEKRVPELAALARDDKPTR